MSTRNLIANPSMENDLTGWALWAGGVSTGTLYRNGPGNGNYVGIYNLAASFTATPGANSGCYYTISSGLVAGKAYSAGIFVSPNVARQMYVQFEWLNSTGGQISTSGAAPVTVPAGVWTRIVTENKIAPAGAVGCRVTVYSPAFASGDIFWADAAILVQGTTVPKYFDGDTVDSGVDSYGWLGTPGSSQSQHNVTSTPQIDIYTDWKPTPRVGITFTEFIFGTETATVFRLTDDGEAVVVPGAEQIGAIGGLTTIDSYAPLGSVTQYFAQMFDQYGNYLGYTPSNAALIPIYDTTIIQSPSDPSIFAIVDMQEDAGSDLGNAADSTTYNIQGRRIAISDQTQLLDSVPMGFFTDSLSSYAAALKVAKNDSNQIVYRTPPPMLVPRVFYTLGKPRREEFNRPAGLEDVEWKNTVDEISPPASNIVAPAVTYAPYTTAFATYAAFQAAYASYLDAERNPPAVNS